MEQGVSQRACNSDGDEAGRENGGWNDGEEAVGAAASPVGSSSGGAERQNQHKIIPLT